MSQNRLMSTLVIGVLLLTGCMLPGQTLPGFGSKVPSSGRGAKAVASPPVETSAASAPTQAPLEFFGRVLGLDGRPAVGVLVRGFIISNNGANVVSSGSGSIISHNGGNIISHNGGNYRTLSVPLETRTDDQGHFKLVSEDGQPLNLEAVASEDVKAFQREVASTAKNVTLQLAHTGAITGRVKAAAGSTVTNFQGVDVYVPGTSYLAKTDASGAFTLTNMPVGTFAVVASKAGVGEATLNDVAVVSKATTQVPDLVLTVNPPTVTRLSPDFGGEGTEVVISGEHFGASTGEAFSVSFGGVTHPAPIRVDDRTIKVKVPVGMQAKDVFVTVGGLQSNASPFRVVHHILMSKTEFIRLGRRQPFYVQALDSDLAPLPTASTEVAIDGNALLFQDGLIEARSLGKATVTASCGALRASAELTVVDEPVVETLAGSGVPGAANGLGTEAAFNMPAGILLWTGGLLLADSANHLIRYIDINEHGHGTAYTLAGTGVVGHENGPSMSARFNIPVGIGRDAGDNIYLAELGGNRIRKIARVNLSVTTVAGDGTRNYVDGPALTSSFYVPHLLLVDGVGEVYVADSGNHSIRIVNSSGSVATLAGSGEPGYEDTVASEASFNTPVGLAMDASGVLFVADSGNNRIRKVSPDGTVTTFVGQAEAGLIDGDSSRAAFNKPGGLAFDDQGNLFVVDSGNHCIRMVTPAGVVTTVAGTGIPGLNDGIGSTAQFKEPFGIAVDSERKVLYVTDAGNHCVKAIMY